MYLLDTNILSEVRKRKPDPNVGSWFEAVPSNALYLSVVTVFEIELGIEKRRQDDPAFAEIFASWLEAVLGLYGERVLPITTNITKRWGRMSARAGNKDLDLAIAATALEHDLIVVTRNVTHFDRTGVPIVNPFEAKARRR
jgi:predicted nucleic acid-binding protein